MDTMTIKAIKDEVSKRGWKFETIGDEGLIYKVTDDLGREDIGRGGRFTGSSVNGVVVSQNKFLSYQYVTSLGFEVPKFCIYKNETEAKLFLDKLGSIVVKPSDADQGMGVTVDVDNYDKLSKAYLLAKNHSVRDTVILQEQLEGNLYRLLVIGGKFFAAACKHLVYVIGDGSSTVKELIADKNKDPLRSMSALTPLKTIKLEDVRACIGDDGLAETPPIGVRKTVINIASISMGGESEDATDLVHDDYIAAVERISRSLKLDICGFDIISKDISVSAGPRVLPLVELNSLPGFRMHMYPTAGGVPRNPAPAVLDVAFPAV